MASSADSPFRLASPIFLEASLRCAFNVSTFCSKSRRFWSNSKTSSISSALTPRVASFSLNQSGWRRIFLISSILSPPIKKSHFILKILGRNGSGSAVPPKFGIKLICHPRNG